MPQEEEVGVKRKERDREVESAGVSKKRVVQEEAILNSQTKTVPTPASSAQEALTDSHDVDDYVVISNRKKSTRPTLPTASKTKKSKAMVANSTALSQDSVPGTTTGGAAPLLPSVTPLARMSTTHKNLSVDTSHEPKMIPEVCHKEAVRGKRAAPRVSQDSRGCFPKLMILLLGIIISFIPFVFFRTNDTLALAALNGQSNLMKVMLKMGADVEVRNKEGETLLLEACRLSNKKAVQLLLDCGSSTKAVNKYGDSPLAVAFRLGNLNIADTLIKAGANVEARDRLNNDTLLLQAVRRGNFVHMNYLIEAGANLEAMSKVGEVPLVIALRTNQLSMAKTLLAAGANVDVSVNGETLLSRVVFYDDYDKAKLLLDAGADVETFGKDGVKPLMLATLHGNSEIVDLILANHADTEAKTTDHWTPLLVAAEHGRLEIVSMLVAAGADLNAVTEEDGKTSLMWAIVKGHDHVASCLIKAGADVNIKSKAGNDAAAIARQFGRRDIEKLLSFNVAPGMRRIN